MSGTPSARPKRRRAVRLNTVGNVLYAAGHQLLFDDDTQDDLETVFWPDPNPVHLSLAVRRLQDQQAIPGTAHVFLPDGTKHVIADHLQEEAA